MTDKQLVYIEFIDHGSSADWREGADIDLKSAFNDSVLRAVGWVLAEDKHFICLGSFLHDDARSHSRQYIVKAAITKRRTLKVPR